MDLVGALTESSNLRRFWSELRRKSLVEEGVSQLNEKIEQLKFKASDGKMYKTDAADMQGIFHIIPPIPHQRQGFIK